MRILPRDGGGGGVSTSTIIVIAVVCGAIGILALTLFLWRLVARLFRRENPTPLPPVQALAHHREAHVAAFSSRPTTWMDGSINGRSHHFLHPTSSSVSLIPGTPDRKSSFYNDEVTIESGYSLASPLSTDDVNLPPPNPRFFVSATGLSSPHASIHSMASSTASSDVSTSPTGGVSPSPSTPSPEYTADHAIIPNNPLPSSHSINRTPRAPPDVWHSSRPRPTSMVSLSGSVYSSLTMRTNGTTVRGAPHGPRSNVQIVLPAPLAPQVMPYMYPLAEGSLSNMDFTESARSSVVDQWVMVGGGPVTVNTNRMKHDLRTSASNVPRRGHKRPSSSFTRSASPLGMSSRSLSRPRSSVSSPTIPMSASFASTITPAHIYDLPPVPPIPPTYGAEVPQQPLQNLVGEVERGRSTISRSNSLASVPEKPLPVEPQSPPQPTRNPSNKGRTLQKPKPANVS